ncbi:FAD/NAD(P)-binding protein [Aerococcaceae bacterium 50-4]
MQIALVGLGVAGNGTLKALVDFLQQHPDQSFHIDIYDNPTHLGHGFAYQEDDNKLIMNSLPQDLSIDEDNSHDLLDWLTDNHLGEYDENSFIPRPIYGAYLKDRMAKYLKHEQVQIHDQLVTDIQVVDQNGHIITNSLGSPYHYQIQTSDGAWQASIYQAVFLNIGHPPYADHYQLLGHDGYIHDPYPVSDKLDKVDPSQKIAIIGSGLTGLDVMRYLQYHFKGQLDRSVTFLTRSTPFSSAKQGPYAGHIHATFDDDWIAEQKAAHQGYVPLDNILETFMADMAANDIDIKRVVDRYGTGSISEIRQELTNFDRNLQIFQIYTGIITPYLPDLYMGMSLLDRNTYQQEYLDIFEHFRSQMTQEALRDIMAWYDQEKVSFHDKLTDIKPHSDAGFEVIFENGSSKHVDILVNAAGFESQLLGAIEQDPFIKNMVNRDIFTPGLDGGVLITWPQAQVTSQRYATHDNLFLTGRWIMTTQYGNNNAQMSFAFGKQIAEQFLDRYTK